MTLTKKGSRRIVVDGQEYRWQIRRKPTYSQDCEYGTMTVAVERFTNPGSALTIDTGRYRLDSCIWRYRTDGQSVTPSEIAQSIRDALAAGWRPADKGKLFRHEIRISGADQTNRFGSENHP
jgi:hypothetical protein